MKKIETRAALLNREGCVPEYVRQSKFRLASLTLPYLICAGGWVVRRDFVHPGAENASRVSGQTRRALGVSPGYEPGRLTGADRGHGEQYLPATW